MTGVERIAAERKRQVEKEGWNAEHDELHVEGQILMAGVCYAACTIPGADEEMILTHFWPHEWAPSWWKPSSDPVRNLEKAGALIAAEIDRLTRNAQCP